MRCMLMAGPKIMSLPRSLASAAIPSPYLYAISVLHVAARAEPVGKKVAESVLKCKEFHECGSISSRMPKGPSAYSMSGIFRRSTPADENMFFPWSMFIFSSSVISAMMFVISSSCCVRGLTFSLVGLHAEKHPPMQISNDNVECFMV